MKTTPIEHSQSNIFLALSFQAYFCGKKILVEAAVSKAMCGLGKQRNREY